MSSPVLEVANLSVAIKGIGDRPHAVRGINLSVNANEIIKIKVLRTMAGGHWTFGG